MTRFTRKQPILLHNSFGDNKSHHRHTSSWLGVEPAVDNWTP